MRPKSYRPYAPRQSFLLPPSPLEWLPEDHLAYFILDVVAQLDLSAIHTPIQTKDPRGNRPFDPEMMVALLLYTWCEGQRSSRRIAKLTYTDVACRVLAADQHPHFSVLADFRTTHARALADLFEQVLLIADKAGFTPLRHVAVDGTKLQANASKHKAMSYERMQQTRERLQAEIAQILAQAEDTDQREDAQFGAERDGSEIADELKRRETRQATLQRAMDELEAECRQARAHQLRQQAQRAEESAATAEDPAERKRAATRAQQRKNAADELDPPVEDPPSSPPFVSAEGLPLNQPPTTPAGAPAPKAQRNFTDPDSRIMEKGGSFLQGFNCQAAVDEQHQFIVGCAVSNQSPDSGNLVPMVAQVKENLGRAPEAATADTGYWHPEAEEACRKLGTEAYIATKREKHNASTAEEAPPAEEALTAKARMAARVKSAAGQAIYRRRKSVVEPVFGQMKEGRGLKRFLWRGLQAVGLEWKFECACHNLLKLFRLRARTRLRLAAG